MKSEIFEIFLEALRQVFAETGIEIHSLQPLGETSATDQVVTSIGIAGSVKGNFMLFTDFAGATNIIKAMMGNVRIPFPRKGLGEVQRTALGELSNQISGRAVTILSERGLECDITPPIIITAESLSSQVPDLMESFSRVVTGPFGGLRLFLAIRLEEAQK